MVKVTHILAAAVLGAGLGSAVHAQFSQANSERGVSLFVWSEELSGDVGGRNGAISGQGRINDDKNTAVGIAGNFGKWELAYTKLDHDTTGSVNTTFTFDGRTFTAGDTFRLRHDVSMFDIFRRHTFVSNPQTTISGLFGFKVLGIDSNLQGTSGASTGINSSLDETVPLPMIGVVGRFGPRQGLQGFAGLRYFNLDVSDNEAEVLELNVGVAYRRSNFHGAVGYRSFGLDVESDAGQTTSASIDLENEGIYFQFGVDL